MNQATTPQNNEAKKSNAPTCTWLKMKTGQQTTTTNRTQTWNAPHQLPKPGLCLRGHAPALAHGRRVDGHDLLPPRRVGHAHLMYVYYVRICVCVYEYRT